MEKRVAKSTGSESAAESTRIRMFAIITMALVLLAVVSILLIPRGTKLQQCEGILLGSDKDVCIYSLALSTQNSTLCGYLSQPRANSCYVNIAENTSNSNLCGMVANDNQTMAGCIGFFVNESGDYSMCDSLGGGYRDACLITQATMQNDSSICAGVSQQNATACYSAVDLRLAVSTESKSYCNMMPNTTDFNNTMKAVSYSNIELYPKVATNTTPLLEYAIFTAGANFGIRNFCYVAIAAQASNTSTCSYVTSPYFEQACYSTAFSTAAPANSSVPLGNVTYNDFFASCYNQTKNAGECNSTLAVLRAASSQNATECAKLNQSASTACYVYVAEASHNSAICSNIKNLTINTACVQDTTLNATTAPPPGITVP